MPRIFLWHSSAGGDPQPGDGKRWGLLQRLVIRLIINAAALYLADLVISGIHLDGWKTILVVAAIFGIVNALIKPFAQMASCCLQVFTLGLFTFIINAGMLYLTQWVAHRLGASFEIENFLSALLGALLISVVSAVISKALK